MFDWLFRRRERKITKLAAKALSREDDVRKAALKSLGAMRDPRAAAAIIRALFKPNDFWPSDGGQPSVSCKSEREALTQLGDFALEELLLALRDPSLEQHFWWGLAVSTIAAVLGEIGDRRALDPLVSVLAGKRILSRDQMGDDPSPVDPIAKALDKIEPKWRTLDAAQNINTVLKEKLGVVTPDRGDVSGPRTSVGPSVLQVGPNPTIDVDKGTDKHST